MTTKVKIVAAGTIGVIALSVAIYHERGKYRRPVGGTENVPRTDHAALAAMARAAGNGPGLRSVKQAAETKTHPERLSPLIPAQPFDRARFDDDPRTYLDVVEPGRCFQTARATGPNTITLEAAGALAPSVHEGDTVLLPVQGVPLAPVTFTVFGQGRFVENSLNSVSVQSDAQGYAVVHFLVPRDFTGQIPILVGSPLAVGNQTFTLDVHGAVRN